MLLAISGAASADPYVRVQSPSIGGIQTPPYGPGFGQGVIVGPRDGCRNYNCPPTDLQNRPAHRRYYENYFKVPEPTYSGQRKIRGNPALNPSSPESCAARYRSYRASDNTYQPFEGPRRLCSG
ncbi:MAG: BA14K family protein [Mesorhizobium sp.]